MPPEHPRATPRGAQEGQRSVSEPQDDKRSEPRQLQDRPGSPLGGQTLVWCRPWGAIWDGFRRFWAAISDNVGKTWGRICERQSRLCHSERAANCVESFFVQQVPQRFFNERKELSMLMKAKENLEKD